MKWIEYQILCNKDENIFLDKKLEYTEDNLTIAKNEAYNGQYYIKEDDNTFEKKPLEIKLGGTGSNTLKGAQDNLGITNLEAFIKNIMSAFNGDVTKGLSYVLNAGGKSYSCNGIGTATNLEGKEVRIASLVSNGLPVTRIGSYVFYITDDPEIIPSRPIRNSIVIIPSTVTHIEAGAFGNAYAKAIKIPRSVIYIDTDYWTFECSCKAIYYEGTEEEWAAIEGSESVNVTDVTVHYNSYHAIVTEENWG